ncbi:cell wall metabolism sensor histidine kinase WalK [Cohnella sp. REN36]|uniref:sensor histidine kinase n=1 Tax=Cohnella sp. REN36 TaxID=2887347 RepID=UPI001D15ABEF|nr:HAMP domain-containing sensor histidine kinase [Cohnella sp. REN36]MCC3376823.1 HAMP domain-containing histidine kinase [Cohnella sp. REN36]
MKTLYFRIVVTFVLVALASGIVGLLLTSVYYEFLVRPDNERKVAAVAENVQALYEQRPVSDLDGYLSRVAALGLQIYAVFPDGRHRTYGSPFKRGQLTAEQVQAVLSGGSYRGMAEENRKLELLAYFENSVRNTVGVPIRTPAGPAALFIRPDLAQQTGEVRVIVAVLLGGTFVVSLLLIAVLSRYIVRPVKALTRATRRIVEGDYEIRLSVGRRDEIGDLAQHFSRMAEAIRQLDERRQAFVANVSHEIQSPLTSIQGFARAVREGEGTPEERDRYLAVIEEESGRLSALGKQLLTLAFLDKDGADLDKTTFRLDEQIRQALILLEWQWSEKSLALELVLPDTEISGDRSLLYEVWLNLIANSIKFSNPEGTIAVRIADGPKGSVAVEIADTGVGIPAAELPYIFERFHKADPSRDRSASGSGLGLSIAHKIVALHGGDILVRSEPGRGTAFTVTLPRL